MLILYVCYNAYTHTAYMHINSCIYVHLEAYQVALMVNPPAIAGDMRWEDPLEEGMATHSGIFAWRVPWTEEPGSLQTIGSQRVGHD